MADETRRLVLALRDAASVAEASASSDLEAAAARFDDAADAMMVDAGAESTRRFLGAWSGAMRLLATHEGRTVSELIVEGYGRWRVDT